MACPEDLKPINTDTDDITMETDDIPISIKAEPGGLDGYDIKNQTSDRIDIISYDGAGPSSYQLKSEEVDLGELKLEVDEDSSEQSKEEDSKRSNLTSHMRKQGRSSGITFDCVKCRKKFLSKRSIDGHIARMHSHDVKMMETITRKIYRCDYCKYVTVINTGLANHMRIHGIYCGVTFDCTKCGKEYLRKNSLDDHIVKMHSDDVKMMETITGKIYNCHHCKYVTVAKANLTAHMRTHGKKNHCIECKIQLSSENPLDNHSNDVKMMESITKKMYCCNKHCEYVTIKKRKLTGHMRTHGEKVGVTYGCTKCRKEFAGKRALDNHIVRMHSHDVNMMESVTHSVYRCHDCEYVTVTKHHLIYHMGTHRENLRVTFDCTNCRKKFSTKTILDNHIVRMHSQDVNMMRSITKKIYHCNHCEYVTIIKHHLTDHMRTHGEKFGVTYGCTKCRKEFTRKTALDDHIVRTHSHDVNMMESITKKINRCNHCEYVTIVKRNLTVHMRTHGEKFGVTFDCTKCRKEFSTKAVLDDHIMRTHSHDVNMMESITNKIYRCSHCEYITIIKRNLTGHMTTHGGKV